MEDFLAADLGDQVLRQILTSAASGLLRMTRGLAASGLLRMTRFCHFERSREISSDHDFPRHDAFFADHAGEGAGVDAGDARHVFPLEPVAEAFDGVPVAVVLAVIGDYEAADMDPFGLGAEGEPVRARAHVGRPVVAHERVADAEDLPLERGVREAFGIPHHRGGEHHLAGRRAVVTEAPAFQDPAVAEPELCRFPCHFELVEKSVIGSGSRRP